MFNNNFVVAIKHKGNILREFKDIVYLPFGAEYTIVLKNLHVVKAVASVSVDGSDVLDGNRLVIKPNETLDLDGFMRGFSVRNRFKFIKKTDKISKYRGDRIDDGIIRVEFQFEMLNNFPIYNPYRDSVYRYWDANGTGVKYTNPTFNTCEVRASKSISNDGITMNGSSVDIDYSTAEVGNLSRTKDVITLCLKGSNDRSDKVKEVVRVSKKQICSICGTKNSSRNKYCYDCGAYLIH